jgi:hypothetical protein
MKPILMAMSHNGNGNRCGMRSVPGNGHPAPDVLVVGKEAAGAWLAFIRYCRQMGFGEIEKLRIQDGVPILAEVTTRKVKFDA